MKIKYFFLESILLLMFWVDFNIGYFGCYVLVGKIFVERVKGFEDCYFMVFYLVILGIVL